MHLVRISMISSSHPPRLSLLAGDRPIRARAAPKQRAVLPLWEGGGVTSSRPDILSSSSLSSSQTVILPDCHPPRLSSSQTVILGFWEPVPSIQASDPVNRKMKSKILLAEVSNLARVSRRNKKLKILTLTVNLNKRLINRVQKIGVLGGSLSRWLAGLCIHYRLKV